jgi:hypothetical protein
MLHGTCSLPEGGTMSRFVPTCFFVVAAATSIAYSQTSPQIVTVVGIRQFDSSQPMDAWVELQRTEIYLDAPSAEVPVRAAVPGATVAASSFRIRAWKEGEAPRVVVYAVMADPRAPRRETETAIATFLLAVGGSMVVSQTQEWGGKPIMVSVSQRQRQSGT